MNKKKTKRETRHLDANVVHCPHCGRIWVRDLEIGFDNCDKCSGELYPIEKGIVVGEELRLADGYEARVVGINK